MSFLVLLIASAAATEPASLTKATYAKASFVPPAAPTLVSPLKPVKPEGWPSAVNHPSRVQQKIIQVATGYGTYRVAPPSTSPLYAKKKGRGGGGVGAATRPVSQKGKIQVQLLETVPNLGQAGDVVFVSSAVFQNQLQRSKKARLIGEEEVQRMEQEKQEQEQELAEMAKKTKAMMEEAMLENIGEEDQCGESGEDICGVALEMKRKAGPTGNLFGGVNSKMVMDALRESYPEGSWDGRQVKVTEVKDMDGNDVKKKDIKHTGAYTVTVALGKGVDVTFILSISEE